MLRQGEHRKYSLLGRLVIGADDFGSDVNGSVVVEKTGSPLLKDDGISVFQPDLPDNITQIYQ